jgi:hypothetical protein
VEGINSTVINPFLCFVWYFLGKTLQRDYEMRSSLLKLFALIVLSFLRTTSAQCDATVLVKSNAKYHGTTDTLVQFVSDKGERTPTYAPGAEVHLENGHYRIDLIGQEFLQKACPNQLTIVGNMGRLELTIDCPDQSCEKVTCSIN